MTRAIRSTRLVFETGMFRLLKSFRVCNGGAGPRFPRALALKNSPPDSTIVEGHCEGDRRGRMTKGWFSLCSPGLASSRSPFRRRRRTPSPELRAAADQVVALLQGERQPRGIVHARSSSPRCRRRRSRAIAGQLVAQYGAARRVAADRAAVRHGRRRAFRVRARHRAHAAGRSSRSRRTGSPACWSPAPTCAATASRR